MQSLCQARNAAGKATEGVENGAVAQGLGSCGIINQGLTKS